MGVWSGISPNAPARPTVAVPKQPQTSRNDPSLSRKAVDGLRLTIGHHTPKAAPPQSRSIDRNVFQNTTPESSDFECRPKRGMTVRGHQSDRQNVQSRARKADAAGSPDTEARTRRGSRQG